jgi:uncharacterized protein YjbI with pentapeptide repeats
MGRKKPGRKKSLQKQSRWGFRGMTVRDWLPIVGALLIPLVIALGTWRLTWQQAKIEDQRAQAERELEKQRAQDAALQAYLDQMTQLMLDRDLRSSDQDSEVRTIARARTSTLLGSLDPNRKKDVLQFLYESNLIDRENPIVELIGADLRSVDLSYTNLGGGSFVVDTRDPIHPGRVVMKTSGGLPDAGGVDLSGADLSSANLEHTWLMAADLREARLSGTNLTTAVLLPDLREMTPMLDMHPDEYGEFLADLPEEHVAVLQGAFLDDADLHAAALQGADLSNADLTSADLSESHLTGASLADANLSGANLYRAGLSGANLSGANVSPEQLAQAASLEGATMPNGQKYEDWLKSKDRGENTSPPS